ncbi:MAG: hypothetical protein LHW45_06555 [Candidatus Cloacimonetes bacterium]|nr:hypothetical protein [Candidatus Cloacimonadota bacterium]MDY0367271.1 hypothetical protein [Candidatus Syntrophosphaera sp.]HOY85064.1 hypothetical protein [Candidatus Syntrophosphaera sp.]
MTKPHAQFLKLWFEYVAIPLLCIVTACMVYLIYPPSNVFVQKTMNLFDLGITCDLDILRNPILRGARNYLPDSLWALALLHILTSLWKPKQIGGCISLVSLYLVFTMSIELGQLYRLIPGTFDIYDELVYATMGLCYLLISISKKTKLTNRRRKTNEN